jgi:uroporphyrinogen decarboxylase
MRGMSDSGGDIEFHSCGYVDTLMEDLIEVVEIDAIHSFEDVIEPVESVFQRYGDRIAVLGGVDVNLLARGTLRQVRARCREILDVCGGKGGFAPGSGNSVTNYCKIENFYAMIGETRSWNEEKGLGA